MALLIKPDGAVITVQPKNGKTFTAEELHDYVGGYLEAVHTLANRVMFVNEDGKYLGLPPNQKATDLYGNPLDIVVGSVVVCNRSEVE